MESSGNQSFVVDVDEFVDGQLEEGFQVAKVE